MTPRVGVVVLTQGKRPDDLRVAVESVLAQSAVDLDVVCVGNGWEPAGLPGEVRTLALAENVGIPAGRAAGVPHVNGELLLFIDDDARLLDDDFLSDVAARFAADPHLGIVQPRVDSPGPTSAPTRWIPRMRKGDPRHSSPVFSLWEGVLVARRAAYDASGGWGRRTSTPTRASSWHGGSGTPVTPSGTPATCAASTRRSTPPDIVPTSASTRATGCGWPAATSAGRSPGCTSARGPPSSWSVRYGGPRRGAAWDRGGAAGSKGGAATRAVAARCAGRRSGG
ncbi:MAG: glycosyltransferase [Nocardioidaceae bacterium]